MQLDVSDGEAGHAPVVVANLVSRAHDACFALLCEMSSLRRMEQEVGIYSLVISIISSDSSLFLFLLYKEYKLQKKPYSYTPAPANLELILSKL